jgi:cold shock CspA family protein
MPPSYLRSFSTPAFVDDQKVQLERSEGVVTRICSYKYGFIQTKELKNIFFHFSELSDEAKAVVEPGCRVQYKVTTNEWTTDKKMKAVDIRVISTPEQNAYKNMKGVVHRELGPRGFGFIQSGNTTYFFPTNELVADDECNKRGNTARAGDEVVFDASWNHKYNPPKPYATNVRLVPDLSASARPTLSARSQRMMTRSNSAFCHSTSTTNNGSGGSPSSSSSGSDGDGDDRASPITPGCSGSWRERKNANSSDGGATTSRGSVRDNRSRTHARGSSLANLIPLEGDGATTTAACAGFGSLDAHPPAVGRTSGNRVSRVMGSVQPYSGDHHPVMGMCPVHEEPSADHDRDRRSPPTPAGFRGGERHLDTLDEGPPVPLNNRALALKQCDAPVRVGARTQSADLDLPAPGDDTSNIGGDTRDGSDKGGGSSSNNHAGNPTTSNANTDESSDDGTGAAAEPQPSMGEASLRVLVQALVLQGKTQYLVIRNALQRPEYFGRSLTREEKQTISSILQDSMNQQEEDEKEEEEEEVVAAGGSRKNGRRRNSSKRHGSSGKGNKGNKGNKENKPAQSNSKGGSGMRRSNSKGLRRATSRGGPSRGLSRCNSTSENNSSFSRPPLARVPSMGARLTLTERMSQMSTTDRLSLTTDRLSLSKQHSNASSFGGDYDGSAFDAEDGYGGGAGGAGGNQQADADQHYSLFADEPMRVSDCLAPVACP